MVPRLSSTILSLLSISFLSLIEAAPPVRGTCRAIPGDKAWPQEKAWSTLNEEVEGRLIKTVPLAAVCHEPNYDEAKCTELRNGWYLSETHFPSTTSILAPYFQNVSCDPYSDACDIGSYPEYAIEVRKVSDVVAGLRFAQKNNIRLVVKNTGHDLMGRSTGLGSLSIWTRRLQEIKILDNFKGPTYSGRAIKLGAGVQAYQAYEAAEAAGLRVVGGTCPTVGLTGGFTQGGGLSLLSTQHGLSADQVLEWEVVTADGRHLIATPDRNSDLYWALSGGGGGTYGVVLSMTVKGHPDGPVAGASFLVTAQDESETFFKSVTEFHNQLVGWVDGGASAAYFLTTGRLGIEPAIFPGKSEVEVQAVLKTLADKYDELGPGIAYNYSVKTFPTYLRFFENYLGPLPYGRITLSVNQGGRLIPRKTLVESGEEFTSALRTVVSKPGFQFIGIGTNPKAPANIKQNAVLPGWRKTVVSGMWTRNWDFNISYAENKAFQDLITDELGPLVESVTGSDSGAYLNGADFQRTDSAHEFFGDNYERLGKIKKKYDPKDLFYAPKLVGSEAWVEASDGRLCRP